MFLALASEALADEAANLQLALQGCEKQYQRSVKRICEAPVRARNAKLKQQCYDEVTQHRADCLTHVQERYDKAARRREKLQQ
jgi:hypothetical protein